MIIAFTGAAGAGKDTAAAALPKTWTRLRFADPLKDMLRSLLYSAGRKSQFVEACIEGDMKETPLEIFGNKSLRQMIQTLGTEWGRDLIHEDMWVRIAMERAQNFDKVVFTDCRFENEARAVRDAGGKIFRIERAMPSRSPGRHASEAGIAEVDATILNDGSMDEFRHRVLGTIKAHLTCQ